MMGEIGSILSGNTGDQGCFAGGHATPLRRNTLLIDDLAVAASLRGWGGWPGGAERSSSGGRRTFETVDTSCRGVMGQRSPRGDHIHP